MKSQGAALSPEGRAAVASYLSKSTPPEQMQIKTGFCSAQARVINSVALWNGWGGNPANTRFQTDDLGRLTAKDVSRLKLKWAFGFPKGGTAAQPVIANGTVLVGGTDGLYSLDAKIGCIRWIFHEPSGVRAAASVSPEGKTVYVAANGGKVYAVNAADGKAIWTAAVDQNPIARLTGAPLLVNGRLYVPVSSGEEASAISSSYECCKFRGSIVALNADNGHQLWKTYAIPTEPRPIGKNARGTTMYGPAGAAIWASPSFDARRNAIYVATGNAYSDLDDPHADAILALEPEQGRLLWTRQLEQDDRWNLACIIGTDRTNCPPRAGGDFDFGASPIVAHLEGGRDLVLVGQKSGLVYALDPDGKGNVVWRKRLGQGGALGGIEWGGALAGQTVFYAVSDWQKGKPQAGGGLVALRADTGDQIWRVQPPAPDCLDKPACSVAQLAPLTALSDVLFSGSMDGHLRAYNPQNGAVTWDFNTAREFETVDGIPAHGGSLNASGPAIADRMLFLTSGQAQGMLGNVLLAFAPEEPSTSANRQ